MFLQKYNIFSFRNRRFKNMMSRIRRYEKIGSFAFANNPISQIFTFLKTLFY